MHRTIKPHPHHLRYAARIVAVRLVDLRLQHRPRSQTDIIGAKLADWSVLYQISVILTPLMIPKEAWNKLVDQPWRIMSIGLRAWAHGF